jgi:quercetin dioxygenase-like cupin family protein
MIHRDKRGSIKDLIVKKGASVTYITFKKGAIRGNHYHKETIQHDFILSGKLLCAAGNKQERVEKGELITHEAKIPHAYEALEDSEMVSICFGKRVGEDYSKDTFKLDTPLL